MGLRSIAGIVTCLGALLVAPTMAACQSDPSPFTKVEQGIFCPHEPTGRESAAGTITGNIRIIDQQQPVAIPTRLVPGMLGIEFGLRIIVDPETDIRQLAVRLLHPPMGGDASVSQGWRMKIRPGESHVNTWLFEHPYEIVYGKWNFQILDGDAVLVEREFSVYDPKDEHLQPCDSYKVIS